MNRTNPVGRRPSRRARGPELAEGLRSPPSKSKDERGGERSHRPTAFTLVELTAVIGLMIVLTASISLAFRREGNAGVALRAAQREIGAALRLAQRTAAARQMPVRLGVLTQPAPGADPGGTGRQWWLLAAEGSDWVRLREAGELPPGTRLVPSEKSGLRLSIGVTWPEELLSQFEGPVAWEDGAMEYLEFRPDGSVAGGPRRIVVAVADEAPSQVPGLLDPAAIRVVRITAGGRIEEDER